MTKKGRMRFEGVENRFILGRYSAIFPQEYMKFNEKKEYKRGKGNFACCRDGKDETAGE